jgi:hypothetical protein
MTKRPCELCNETKESCLEVEMKKEVDNHLYNVKMVVCDDCLQKLEMGEEIYVKCAP